MADADALLSALIGNSSRMMAEEPEVDPGTLGMLKAYQDSEFLQGRPTHTGPIGHITQALTPLLNAKIYGAEAARQQKLDQLKTMGAIVGIIKELRGQDLSSKELALKLKEMVFKERMLGQMESGKLPAGSTISYGGITMPVGTKPATGDLGMVERANDPNADPEARRQAQQTLDALRQQKQTETRDRLSIENQLKPKSKPPDKMIEGMSSLASNIEELDRVLEAVSDPTKINRTAALTSSVTGGLLSDPTIRDYE